MSACAGASTVAVGEAGRQQAVASLLCLVNRERATGGAAALRASGALANAATAHSAAMVTAKFLSHTSANGDTVRRRVMRTGYMRKSRGALVGETLAWGSGAFSTPAQLVVALMRSQVHRRTLLDRRFRELGVGMALGAPLANVAGSAATVTMNFGRR